MQNRREQQAAKAEAFRAMHQGPRALVLANVWDVASARILEAAGARAIATSSAAIAFGLGYPDGQRISRSEMLAAVERIASKVRVPVTADLEAGYGERPEDAAATARGAIEAGAVGLNLEDSTGDTDRPLTDISRQIEKIQAVRQAGASLGVPLVINARTDVYLAQVGEPGTRYAETLRRLRAFREAGADCLFVPDLGDGSTIARLIRELACPVNILAGPASLSIPELEQLGVARISLGSWPMRAALGLARRIAQELATTGTYTSLAGAPSHAEVNRLLS